MSNNYQHAEALPGRFKDLERALDTLARDAVDGISVPSDRFDPMFGAFGLVAGFVRSAVCVEGTVLEAGLRTILDHSGRFALLPVGFKLPVIEAAMAAVKSNDKANLKSLRLDPKVYAPEHYTPDLLAVHRETGVAFLIELKRSTLSYPRPILERLEEKMLAAGLVVRDTLNSGRRLTFISRLEVMIVDCADTDMRDQIIGASSLDRLLGYDGVGKAMRHLRARFAVHVQKRLTSLIEGPISTEGTPNSSNQSQSPEPTKASDAFYGWDENAPIAINFANRARLTKAGTGACHGQ
jgi:hypothetical protein|tara:strand:+ start:9796 stop:10680 length:885 start_codon:yes stop_codon:yes gene_type:complete